MVAIIKSGYSIHRIVNYNENKVKEGVAVCIGAGNYPLDPEQMNITMRLNGLLANTELNQTAKRNSVHISLNFDPTETNLTDAKMMEIAESYMQKIGFGEQPYLVYRHHDAAHPHIHIATTQIKADGKAIPTYMIGERKSEPARKAIEKSFGLVSAEAQGKTIDYRPQPVSVGQVSYGKLETKKAIQNVLEHTISKYRYTSLSELNAVLGCYNVMAQAGEEGSRMEWHGGLLYRVLDDAGNPVGVPIKASAFYNKPTLKNLRKLFVINQGKRIRHKARLKNAVDVALDRKGITLDRFTEELSSQGIDVIARRNEQGFLYGVTYVDHVTKCVFNGSVLGKPYSAKAIRDRCAIPLVSSPDETRGEREQIEHSQQPSDARTRVLPPLSGHTFGLLVTEFLDRLFEQEYVPDYVPYELSLRKKKRKRKRKSDNR
ncbi:MAG: relaxase/mobilization nuclease domain-containing protein [Crocinitomicaceae bacterium]|nr:relaxase/mobilization nuclease domain-containing protein [Crocinitomicaceae bacterium]